MLQRESPGLKCRSMILDGVAAISSPFQGCSRIRHTAFDKGAAYLKVKLYSFPVNPITRTVDAARAKEAM